MEKKFRAFLVVVASGVAGCRGAGDGRRAPSAEAPGFALRAVDLVGPEGFVRASDGWVARAEGSTLRASGTALEIDHGGRRLALRVEGEGGGMAALDGAADGAARFARDGVVRTVRPVAGGLRVDWRFARRPVGGAIRVALRAEGLADARADGDGLALRASDEGRWRASAGAWFDAGGRGGPVRPRVVGGAVVYEVAASELAGATFPVVLDPEIVVDPALDPTRGQYAGGPTATVRLLPGPSRLTLFFALGGPFVLPVSYAGDPLEPYARRVTLPDAAALAWDVDATSAGHLFLYMTGAPGGGYAIRAAPLDANGRPSAAPTTIATSAGTASRLRVACGASACLASWVDGAASTLLSMRVDLAGRALDASPTALAAGVSDRVSAVATSAGWNVVWGSNAGGVYDVRAAHVASSGALAGPAGGRGLTTFAALRNGPAIAGDGAGALAVWQARAGSGSRAPGVYALRLDASGNDVGTPFVVGAVAADGSGSVPAVLPDVAWNGVSYAVGWGADARVRRVAADGRLLDAAPIALCADAPASCGSLRAVGGGGGAHVALWDREPNSGLDGRRVAGDGALGPVQRYTTFLATHHSPVAMSDGRDFAVYATAVNRATGLLDGLLARVSAEGAVLDDPARVFPAGATALGAWDGSAWHMLGSRAGQLLIPAGVGGAVTTRATPDGRGASVTRLGAALAVVDQGAATVTRIGHDGAALDAFPIRVPYAPTAIGNNGRDYLVASLNGGVFLNRVSGAGDLIDAAPVRLGGGAVPAQGIASDGRAWLVLVTAAPSPTVAYLLRDDLTVARSVTLPAPSPGFGAAAAVHDGRSFVVAWVSPGPPAQVLARRIAADGALLDAAPIVVVTGDVAPAPNAYTPVSTPAPLVSLASNGAGTTLVAYAARDQESDAYRIRATLLGAGATLDGGVDAGAPVADAPAQDASADVASTDGGTSTDAGPPSPDGGCAVRGHARGEAGLLPLAALAMALRRRRTWSRIS